MQNSVFCEFLGKIFSHLCIYFLGLQMSDSDEEDEYTEGKKVFDSDSEAEEEEEINEDALPTDKKRVLDFFNEATEPELVAIQGM